MSRVWTRQNLMLLLAFSAVVSIAIILAWRFGDQTAVITTFLTTIGGGFARDIGGAFSYEFGSSRGSADKTALLAQAEPIKL